MTPEEAAAVIRRSRSINGWFPPGAAYLFALLDNIQKRHGIAGNLFEIGVHHGKSAIMLGMMADKRLEVLGVCDLFAEQALNVSRSGKGDKEILLQNFGSFFPQRDFLRVFEKSSADLTKDDVTNDCRFFHIDGGHSATEVLGDLELAAASLNPNGVIVLDDAFNPAWPGVTEAIFEFFTHHPGELVPVVIGFNKLVLTTSRARDLYFGEIENRTLCWSFIPSQPYKLKALHLYRTPVHIFYVPSWKSEASIRSRLFQWYFQHPLFKKLSRRSRPLHVGSGHTPSVG